MLIVCLNFRVQYALGVFFYYIKNKRNSKNMIFLNTTTNVKALQKSAFCKLLGCIYLFLNIVLACANAVSASKLATLISNSNLKPQVNCSFKFDIYKKFIQSHSLKFLGYCNCFFCVQIFKIMTNLTIKLRF